VLFFFEEKIDGRESSTAVPFRTDEMQLASEYLANTSSPCASAGRKRARERVRRAPMVNLSRYWKGFFRADSHVCFLDSGREFGMHGEETDQGV
jgi:hypothetical protein